LEWLQVEALETLKIMSATVKEHTARAQSGWVAIDWRELWEGRELFYFLVMRDIKVRYKQTVLGVAWAVIQPLITMVIFTVVFGRLAKIPSDGIPYAAFVLAGLLPWTFFQAVVTQASQSLINQQALLTKIYLPRLFIPASPAGSGLVDLGISFVIALIVMAWYGIVPTAGLLLLPALTLIALLGALGAGIWLAAVTVSFRDFRYVVPFMMQSWLYISPVVYPVSLVPDQWRWVMALNPMTGVIDGYRSALLGTPWNHLEIAISSASATMLFILGVRYFRMTERRFADIA
jgi:lipopolysaccharide transport system permease protein